MRSTFNRYFRICVVVAVLPVLMFVLSLVLRSATGPFWQYADPAYIYLLNSVNLVKGIPAAFYDQPGVPLQILGQVVILVLNCGHNAVDAVRSVLINPEFYLDAVNIVLLVLIPLTSIALGVYTYRKTHNFIAVFLSQLPNVFLLTLRTSHYHPVVYATVNAEPLLLCITNIFNLFLLKLFFAKTKKEEYCTVLILGFICGMGIATKLTVIMLLVLPLMVIRWRMKFFFLISLILSFIFWTLPILPVYSKLWAWVIELFTHTGV